MERADPDRRALLAVLALGGVLVAFGLGATPLLEPDEGRYADIARSFGDRGDWVVPRLDGVTFHDKPPFVPWLMALALRAFGPGDAVVRLVSAFAGCCGLVAAAALAGPSRRAAWLAALVLVASPLWLAMAKFATLDATFAALVASAWALVQRGPRARILGGSLLGLALLTKGPVALVLVAGAAGALAARERDPRVAVRLLLVPSLVALAVAAPWYVAFGLRHPDGLKTFLLHENAARFFSWHEHAHGPHFYVVTALWAHAPLGVLLAVLAGRALPARGLVAFVGVTLAVFTVASSKVETYILPASPVLAALIAQRIDGGLSEERARARLVPVAVAVSVLVGLAPLGWLVFASLGGAATKPQLAAIASSAPRSAALAVLAVPVAIAALVAARRRRATAAIGCALAASAVTLLAALPVLQTIARSKSAAPIAALVLEHRRPGTRVVCFTTYVRGLPYHLGEPVTLALSHSELSLETLERERPDLWLADDERVRACFGAHRSLLVVVPPRAEARFVALAEASGATRANGALVARGEAASLLLYELRR